MKILTKACLVLAVAFLSGCTTFNDRQGQTNRRLDRIHTDPQQLHRDLQELAR